MRTYTVSQNMFRNAQQFLASGVSSNLRLEQGPYPLFVTNGKGSRFTDVDGNVYIDYLLAYGPLILGHAHPHWVERVSQQLTRGSAFGFQHEGEAQLARQICAMVPSAELVAYSNSGTEAVQLAIRLARAFTRRPKILRFVGHYHGWADNINVRNQPVHHGASVQPVTAGQDGAAVHNTLLVPWNDKEALQDVLNQYGNEIAAVITEPILCNSGCILPIPGYLEDMRQWCTEHGIVLIFDEVITGFRVAKGGAQERLGVLPDLTTFGKAVSAGVPLSIVTGKRDIMSLIAEGTVNHMGTMNGNPLATTAALAALEVLGSDATLYDQMEQRTRSLTRGIREVLDRCGIPFCLNEAGPVFHLMFTSEKVVRDFDAFLRRDVAKYRRLAQILLDEGVCVRPSGLWYLSVAHTDEDVDQTLSAVERAVTRLQREEV